MLSWQYYCFPFMRNILQCARDNILKLTLSFLSEDYYSDRNLIPFKIMTVTYEL